MPFMLAHRYNADQEWCPLEDQVFEEGQTASIEAKALNARAKSWGDTGRYKVVPIKPEDPFAWRIREEVKFRDGTYSKCPWNEDGYRYDRYYEHIDPEDSTKVRFIAHDRDGQRGRYTVMAPGRFFLKYHDSYPGTGVIEAYCAKMGLDMTVSTLQLATSSDDIERVYTNGPHSCMAYVCDEDHFDSDIHPVRQYGDLDLACAYITRSGEITARCMVWPEKKIYGRIYGDAERIKARLAEEGYTEDWKFVGARLKLERTNFGQIIAPYVDGDVDGTLTDTHIVLVPSDQATLILKSPDGVVAADHCDSCGRSGVPLRWDEDDERYVCENH
jgi:hypothetical protein